MGLIFPSHPTFGNYVDAFAFMQNSGIPLQLAFLNSIIATGVAVLGALSLATLAAYAFATMEFPGRRLLFAVITLGLVVPTSVMIIPEFLTIRSLNLSGRPALLLPYIAFGLSLPTVILTVFFRTIPHEMFEAARVDGARRRHILLHIGLPLLRPALGTAGLFLFLIFWNEFPLALTLINDPRQYTLPLAIANTQARFGTPYQLVAAVMVLASIPVLLAFTLGQRQLIEGLTTGTLKQ